MILVSLLQWGGDFVWGMQQQRYQRYHGTGLAIQYQQRRRSSCHTRHVRQSVAVSAQAGAVIADRHQALVAVGPTISNRLLHYRVQEAARRTRGWRSSAFWRRRSYLQKQRQDGWKECQRPTPPWVSGQDHRVLQQADQAPATEGRYLLTDGECYNEIVQRQTIVFFSQKTLFVKSELLNIDNFKCKVSTINIWKRH